MTDFIIFWHSMYRITSKIIPTTLAANIKQHPRGRSYTGLGPGCITRVPRELSRVWQFPWSWQLVFPDHHISCLRPYVGSPCTSASVSPNAMFSPIATGPWEVL